MRISIMGAGAVGGYYGAQLVKAGEDVVFVARGPHREALESGGIQIISDGITETVRPINVVGDTKVVGSVDVILFAVKAYDTEVAAEACRFMMGDSTYVVTVQNGVESVDILSSVLGGGRVLGGATYFIASIDSPGVIRQTGSWARIEFAEPSGERTDRALAFEKICNAAGIDITLRNDMNLLLWRKFILLASTSAMTGITRQTIGAVRNDEVGREIALECIREAVAVGRALGVPLGPDIEKETFRFFDLDTAPEAKASLLVDLERGKPLELEYLSGALHRLGKKVGVPTPVHSTVYAALRPFSAGL